MRGLTMFFILATSLFSCKPGATAEKALARENSLDNILYTMVHHDVFILKEMRDFIQINHVNDPCADELLLKIIALYDFIDNTQRVLIGKTGGFDVNGYLINRDDQEEYKKILEGAQFVDKKDSIVKSFDTLTNDYSQQVIESIKEDT